jgi:hypothetical protein
MSMNNYLTLDKNRVRLYNYLLSSTHENISKYNKLLKDIQHRYSSISNLKKNFKETYLKFKSIVGCNNNSRLCKNIKNRISNKLSNSNIKDKLFNYNTNNTSGGNFGTNLEPVINDKSIDDLINDSKTKIENIISTYETELKNGNPELRKAKENITFNGAKGGGQKEKFKNGNLDDLIDYKYKLKYNEYFYNSEVNTQDVAIFAFLIFIIRTIILVILKLGIDVNMIQTFEDGMFYYVGLYILFIGIIFALVNMDHSLETNILNIDLTLLKKYLYYFYIDVNGISRIIINITILFIILLIPFIIKSNKNEDIYEENDLKKKRELYKQLGTFSIILWVFQTIIALIIK